MAQTAYSSQPAKSWRLLALVAWVLVALAFLAFYLIDLSLDYDQLLSPCAGDACNYLAISPAEVAVLQSWGLSTRLYAITMTGMTLVSVGVFWLLAGLVLWRQQDFGTGLAVSLTLLVLPIAAIADTDNVAANYPKLLIPSFLLAIIGLCLLFLFVYLLPNGRFVPRWAPIPLAASLFLFILVEMNYSNIITLSSMGIQIVGGGLISLVLLGLIFQIYRYLRVSTPTERLQTRWVLFGLFVTFLGFPIWAFFFGGIVELPAGEIRLIGSLGGWFLSLLTNLTLAFAVAIAILRYRLWNIDLIIRKTLIYLILTGILFLVYLGIVVLLQALFSSLLGDRYTALVTVISTLAVAALFNPLRRRIQNLIDRRFFRQKYDKEKVLSDFSSTLRDEVDLERLQNSILAVVDKTMQPESLTLWVRTGELQQEQKTGPTQIKNQSGQA